MCMHHLLTSHCLLTKKPQDAMLNDFHSRNTRALLSFISSFKDMPVVISPCIAEQSTFEFKSLLTEKKTMETSISQLDASNKVLDEEISKKSIFVKSLQEKVKEKQLKMTEDMKVHSQHKEVSKRKDHLIL